VSGQLSRGRQAVRAADPALPLSLPHPPALPGRLLPEFAVPCLGAFDHPDFQFSIEWDGSRALLFASPEGVRLQSETLADVSGAYPELVAAAEALRGSAAVLDGVIAVLDPHGCPDLAALGERMALGAGAQRIHPTVFLANDLLHLEGRTTMGLPLEQRLDLLRRLGAGNPRVQVPDWVTGEGEALAAAATARRLPALLARRSGARYHPGVASRERLRIALRPRAHCVVVGAAPVPLAGVRRRALKLAEHHRSRLVECAAVELPESSILWRWAAPGGRLRSPLIATVDHQGRDPQGRLRRPSLVTLRDDIDPRWCIRRDPVPPPPSVVVAPHGFHPTVLSALPLYLDAAPAGAPEAPGS
jgi:ATP-dependent DNA ligase